MNQWSRMFATLLVGYMMISSHFKLIRCFQVLLPLIYHVFWALCYKGGLAGSIYISEQNNSMVPVPPSTFEYKNHDTMLIIIYLLYIPCLIMLKSWYFFYHYLLYIYKVRNCLLHPSAKDCHRCSNLYTSRPLRIPAVRMRWISIFYI